MANNEVAFNIDVVGSESKVPFKGKFKCNERLTARLRLEKGRIMRQQLGEFAATADYESRLLAHAFALFAVSITDSPEWFKASSGGQDLCDLNVIETILIEIAKIQGNYEKEEEEKIKEDVKVIKEKLKKDELGEDAE